MKAVKESPPVKESAEGGGADVSTEPKAGGSYVRDPGTGALTRVAGPVANEQPEGN